MCVYSLIENHALYDKFRCQIESGSSRQDFISTNIQKIADPLDSNLQEGLSKSLDTGLSRIEFTIYTRLMPALDKILKYQESMLNLLDDTKVCKEIPHRQRWAHMREMLEKSVIIEFPEQRSFSVLLGINGDTKKILGTSYKSQKDEVKRQQHLEYLSKIEYAKNYITLPG